MLGLCGVVRGGGGALFERKEAMERQGDILQKKDMYLNGVLAKTFASGDSTLFELGSCNIICIGNVIFLLLLQWIYIVPERSAYC